jgi:Beta-lactamase enzyme family
MKRKKRLNLKTGEFISAFKHLGFYQVIASATFVVVASFIIYWLLNSLLPDENKKARSIIASSESPALSSSKGLQSPTNTNGLPNANNKFFAYSLSGKSDFASSKRLEEIVDSIVQYSKSKSLPTSALSITLIDTLTGEKADYQGDALRYPASVVKMFWLVAAYQKINRGELKETEWLPSIEQMILKSDNQGASHLLDAITSTKSTAEKLSEKELETSKQKRQELNSFFSMADYNPKINVSQKTFPIPQENIMEPKGFDQQLRGNDLEKPIRNKITTNDAARLLFEIVTSKSVSPQESSKMKAILTRNIKAGYWKKQPPNPIDFNPVESFFGEGLPEEKTEDIVSKAGWTSVSRQEVAFIQSKDGKVRYILAVFGDDAAYGKSKKVFPEISNLVYKKMQSSSKIKSKL